MNEASESVTIFNPENIPGKYILLAEDDEDDIFLLRSFFQKIPGAPELFVVNKGDKVISMLESLSGNNLPCMIILDYNLPSMSGYEILHLLSRNKKYQSVPVVVWSTSNSPFYESQCQDATAYLVKPSDQSGFQALVQKLLSFIS
jgi:CheY-like chemotaxis protein